MGKQQHTKFRDDFIREIFEKNEKKLLKTEQVLELLEIKRSRFYALLKEYRATVESFSVVYDRPSPRRISPELEPLILKELEHEKKLIDDRQNPVRYYNYNYVKDEIYRKHNLKVSAPTIIKRARENGFYKSRKGKRKAHDREVVTSFPGELIQHDSSIHKFSPHAVREVVFDNFSG